VNFEIKNSSVLLRAYIPYFFNIGNRSYVDRVCRSIEGFHAF